MAMLAYGFNLPARVVAFWTGAGIFGGLLVSSGYYQAWLEREAPPEETPNELERQYAATMWKVGDGGRQVLLPVGVTRAHLRTLQNSIVNGLPITEAYLVDELQAMTQAERTRILNALVDRGYAVRTRQGKRAGYRITEGGKDFISELLFENEI